MCSLRHNDQTNGSEDDSVDPFVSALNAARKSNSAMGQLFEDCRDYLLLIANDELPSDVKQKVAASDIVQETFIEAQRSLSEFQGTAKREFRAWIRRIMVNNLQDAIRQFRTARKRQTSREVPVVQTARDDSPQLEIAGSEETPSKATIREEERQRLVAHLEQLPADYRRVIELRNLEQRTFVEIGHLIGKTPDAVRMLWGRAMRRLANVVVTDDEPAKRS